MSGAPWFSLMEQDMKDIILEPHVVQLERLCSTQEWLVTLSL